MERRPEIDRWIISVLNTLIQDVDRNLADYEPTRAARAIADLLERIFELVRTPQSKAFLGWWHD